MRKQAQKLNNEIFEYHVRHVYKGSQKEVNRNIFCAQMAFSANK